MKKDATQIKLNFTAEHHVEPVISIPTTIEDPTTEHLVASIVCTPKVIEHHAVDVSNGAKQYGTPTSCSLTFTEHTADGSPANTVTPHPSNVCTEVLPVLGYQHLTACADISSASVKTCKTKPLTNEQRDRINKRRRELYREKKESSKPCDVDRWETKKTQTGKHIMQRRKQARYQVKRLSLKRRLVQIVIELTRED
ncbi:uncharacterized protein LOC120706732 isoform X3 [Panicum virgatum]|uniref:uncharacterized protein LOC120706732 isoform X3 n=1 Tax=Panicum virgatum TaxID=38727 RepID=UPI0019D58C1E|nr:uncharacterized protein LOC120706732 isoform X3 [Panicum virgatum]